MLIIWISFTININGVVWAFYPPAIWGAIGAHWEPSGVQLGANGPLGGCLEGLGTLGVPPEGPIYGPKVAPKTLDK